MHTKPLSLLQYVALTIISLTIAILAPLSTAFAVDSSGIGGKPANPNPDNPRSQSIFVYELNPGDSKEDAIEVINSSSDEKTVDVYAVDSVSSSDGAFACAQKADTAVGVGTWITLEKNEVTIAPNSSEKIAFTVDVPESASVGESNGCIAMQGIGDSEATQNGIVLSYRSAIRVAVTIPGDITKSLDFVGPVQTTSQNNKLLLTTGLKNNGNVSLDTDLNIYVKNAFGFTVHEIKGTYPVLANSQATYNFEADSPFWGGFYQIGAEASYVESTELSIGQDGDKKTITAETTWQFVSPQPLALMIEIGVIALFVVLISTLVGRRSRMKKMHRRAAHYTVATGDSLQKIAKEHGTSWKLIAKLNGIKPPYHVEPGESLKIPKKK